MNGWCEITRSCGHATWSDPRAYGIAAQDVVRVAEMVAALAQQPCRACHLAATASLRRLCWGDR